MHTSLWLFFALLGGTFGIQLEGNGYTNVLFAINPAVPESQQLLSKLEEMITEGSKYLYEAAGKRFYFKEVTILVPANWSDPGGKYERARTERYDTANIIIDDPNPYFGDEPYTLQYGQCGDQGQYIHFTPEFLLNDEFIKFYGPRGKVFVHEWAHVRWGVYDEHSDEDPFYLSTDGQGRVEATRCSKNIEGLPCDLSGNICSSCIIDESTGLPTPDCVFVPSSQATARESIMSFPSLDYVTDFCTAEKHNAEAPNRQNQMCSNRATMDVILKLSVDANTPEVSTALPSVVPNITFVQRRTRVVCLTLDVSGSMQGRRILLLQQAATLFLREIVEDGAMVGIVVFQSTPSTLKGLTLIQGEQSREDLVKVLPASANGGTQMCAGIRKGLEVLRQNDNSAEGEELILLTDGEANDVVALCLEEVYKSGSIVHTIALGPNADKNLFEMANRTGGIFFQASDTIDSNALVNAFASLTSSDGNLTHQAIQLESSGKRTSDWFNGTFSVDKTVGKDTVINIVYEMSLPGVFIRDPTGQEIDRSNFTLDAPKRTLSWKIPGIAVTGEWLYSLQNVQPAAPQSMAITVTSRAASADVPPITVKAHMNQKTSNGSKAMVVYAAVSQKGIPVILANVTAILEPDIGNPVELNLKDNGAGADSIRHDGVYSAYFINFTTGRYSLKVRVQNQDKAMLSVPKFNGAPYIPGYVVNGSVELNPPKPPVNQEPVDVGSFTRTATGESFVVELPPGTTQPPAFPPGKITDLSANLQGDNVSLTWTAPGASYDQGTASIYHIHWSKDLSQLQGAFNETPSINSSSVLPQEAGSIEEHTFSAHHLNITNGTTVLFGIVAQNADKLRSETSNIARVVKFVAPAPPPPPPPRPSSNVDVVTIAVTTTFAVVVVGVLIFVVHFKLKGRF